MKHLEKILRLSQRTIFCGNCSAPERNGFCGQEHIGILRELLSKRSKCTFCGEREWLRQALIWRFFKSSLWKEKKWNQSCASRKWNRRKVSYPVGILNISSMQRIIRPQTLPHFYPSSPTMPIRFTQNVAVELGISNGTEGRLLEVEFSHGHAI